MNVVPGRAGFIKNKGAGSAVETLPPVLPHLPPRQTEGLIICSCLILKFAGSRRTKVSPHGARCDAPAQ